MADDAGPAIEATLYEATYYQGNAITVRPDRWDEGEDARVYSLAYLGLIRLGSLKAPVEFTEPDSPLRQHVRAVTRITVWASKPDTWRPTTDEQGTTWQEYSADTADLGAWAAKTAYVRVWRQTTGGAPHSDTLETTGPPHPLLIVE
ncbi:hypothetical protein [Streptomyces katrae]|uniref:hypothetical protein n=1 Tax=Streptomyces katrae TaxID=68223 RepID=UPI0004C00F45|nr:hypothetical protein [Streptomyces katrae]